MSSTLGTPTSSPGLGNQARSPLTDAINKALGDTIQQLMPQIIAGVVTGLMGLLGGLFRKSPPPPPPATEPPPPPVVNPGGGTVPQVPVPTAPTKTLSRVALILSSMEKPEHVGGGPGVNYEDARGMVQHGEAFNYGCVGIFYGKAFDQHGDEYMGPDIIAADLEFRTAYRVFKAGTDELVAFMIGEGDDSPGGEGKPRGWHQSDSGAVNFGVSRWLASAGFDNRLVFRSEGDYDVELEIGGVKSSRMRIRVS
jgi:hypothetical protein